MPGAADLTLAGCSTQGLGQGCEHGLNILPVMPAPESTQRRALDAAALAHVRQRMNSAAQPPWLHAEVARRMAQRLPVVKLRPSQVLNWGAFVGASQALLSRAYPTAQVLTVEASAQRRDATALTLRQPWYSRARWLRPQAHVLCVDDVQAGSAQLLWSNMGLQGSIEPQADMRAWQRALAVDGFLMFSSLGPGTLQSLSRLYAQQGWPAAMAPLVDMHDLGDMLVQSGFADPVMDQETVTLTWATPAAALDELRQLGGNVDPRRFAGLRTPRWRSRLLALLQEQAGGDGRVRLDFEVVYGHAFRAAPRPKLAAQTQVPLEDMRAMVRSTARRS